MPSPSVFRVSLLALITVASACGGGEASRPGPLKYTIDDMYLARVPMEQKTGVLEAKNQYDLARMERASVEAEHSEATTDLEVARNELTQAQLDEKSAQSRKKAADESADLNRMDAAAKDLRIAQLSRQAATKKVDYMKARRELLKKKLLVSEDESYAQEAKYELSKARVAKANNIRPKGFDANNFERQSAERSKHAQRSKALIAREQQKADNLRREWEGLVRESDRARGTAPAPSQSQFQNPSTSPGTNANPQEALETEDEEAEEEQE
jgi:hypothetical protein